MSCDIGLPDACGKEDHLVERRLSSSGGTLCERILERERELIIAVVALVIFLNLPYGQYFLYPFMIFSTWIHEMCHGVAAILVGGEILKIKVYSDGSGLAYTSVPYNGAYALKRAFVASAGYTGTAVVGSILLLFRRTRLGPTVATIGLGALMLISCVLWVRNVWGVFVVLLMGASLVVGGWKLKAAPLGYLFAFLAAACAFNALTSVHALFTPGQCNVGGVKRDSDAHTVADYIGLTYWFWALMWLIFGLIMSFLGIVFAIDDDATLFPSEACGTSTV